MYDVLSRFINKIPSLLSRSTTSLRAFPWLCWSQLPSGEVTRLMLRIDTPDSPRAAWGSEAFLPTFIRILFSRSSSSNFQQELEYWIHSSAASRFRTRRFEKYFQRLLNINLQAQGPAAATSLRRLPYLRRINRGLSSANLSCLFRVTDLGNQASSIKCAY